MRFTSSSVGFALLISKPTGRETVNLSQMHIINIQHTAAPFCRCCRVTVQVLAARPPPVTPLSTKIHFYFWRLGYVLD